MRSRVLGSALIIVAITLIQSTVLEYIEYNGIKPNILLVFIVCSALLGGNITGAVTGFFTGMIQDIVSGKVIGLYALLGMYLGLTLGTLNKRFYRENIMVTLMFTFVATIAYEGMVYFLGVFFKGQVDFLYSMQYKILPEALYNMLVSIVVFKILIKVYKKQDRSEKVSRNY